MDKTASWSGREFSMRPVHPTAAANPVTRVLNMVMGSDGSIEKRRDFGSNPGGSPENHIVAELNGVPYLIIKDNTLIKYSSGGAFATLTMASSDPPINAGLAAAPEKGSFAIHANEVYYCDSNTIVVWDGVNAGRRPGVVGLQGLEYNGTGAKLLPGGPFGKTDLQYTQIPSPSSLYPACDPGIVGSQQPDASHTGLVQKGEKTLNTGFCFSYYDPRRRIYGRRSEVLALPYVFGPPDPDDSNTILSDQRTQYAKVVKCPTAPSAHPEYLIAIWFTPGQLILTNIDATVLSFPFFYFNENTPAMSKRMSGTVFLETIVPAGSTDVFCYKDNASLVQSGRYIDVYERPVPARFMAILANGVAVYLFPWTATPERGGSATELGQHALFSVRHPEQIGLGTDNQRDTISPLPNLKGLPKATFSDGNTQLLLTSQTAYSIGFDGNVVLRELKGLPGLRGINSFTNSSIGELWHADEGPVLYAGGRRVLLGEKLGFSDWYDSLTPTQKTQVVIGAADSLHQILIFSENTTPSESGTHALCWDHEREFVSEFTGVGSPTYAAFFRGGSGGLLYVFGTGTYPGTGYTSTESSLTMWLNDGINIAKTLGHLTIDCGPRTGSITVSVTQHDSGEDVEETSDTVVTKTQTIPKTGGGAGRFTCEEFVGMRGRLFKIKITVDSGNGRNSIQRVRLDYALGEGEDAISN